jgi:hypothetical protein
VTRASDFLSAGVNRVPHEQILQALGEVIQPADRVNQARTKMRRLIAKSQAFQDLRADLALALRVYAPRDLFDVRVRACVCDTCVSLFLCFCLFVCFCLFLFVCCV